jgi:hypothetical protein
VDAYRSAEVAPVGAYRSDSVEPMTPDEVRALVEETFADARSGLDATSGPGGARGTAG